MDIFPCPYDEGVTVLIVTQEDLEYEQLIPHFKVAGFAFTVLGAEPQTIIIDGEAIKEEWFTDDHLEIIMAHELGHLRTNSEDELTADQAGFDILVKHGAPESAISLYALEIQARYCITQENLESHK
jgi:hypothetical protein